MDDLTLVGVHEDGEHLLLLGPSGHRYRLKVDDALRAAVRRDRARLAQLQIEKEGRVRPREIQARIRAGETAEQVAETAGLPVEHVRRYEGPVLAEREFVARQARDVRIRHAGPGPDTLGTLVEERLAQREVDPDDAQWDAWRSEDGAWIVVLRFTAGSKEREARWSYDPAVRHVAALDDEARWLVDDEPPAPAPTLGQRRLSPVRDHVYDVESTGAARPAEDPDPAELLDTLRERRGRRSRPSAEADAMPDPVREAIDSLLNRPDTRPPAAGETVTGRPRPARERPPRREGGKTTARRVPPGTPAPSGDPADRRHPAALGADLCEGLDPETVEAAGDPPAAHPARSRPQDARDGEVLLLPDAAPGEPAADPGTDEEQAPVPAGASRRQPPRKQRRASVPSWDDIVFGQRRD